jgi:uncharacterized protein
MTVVAVIGATGYAGGHIVTEALSRGDEVIAVSRTAPADNRPGVTVRAGEITDERLLAELAEQADVIVVAVHAVAGQEPLLPRVVPALLAAAAAGGARLAFVGGASSLLVAPGGPRLLDTPEFPDAFKFEAGTHAGVLEQLRAADSAADWFYLSPAGGFGSYAPGERTGTFRTGGDLLLTDADGKSEISGEDYAIALVDEIHKPAHHQERFTVAY